MCTLVQKLNGGADLSVVSWYPAEKEICFAPLLGLEVLSDRFDKHDFRVMRMRPTVCQRVLDIEQLSSQRKNTVVTLGCASNASHSACVWCGTMEQGCVSGRKHHDGISAQAADRR